MSDSSSVVVHLLDKEYRVGCDPEEREDLMRAAHFLDDKLREIRSANVIGIERIAVMAALNLAHELQLANRELDRQNQDTSRVATMLSKVEAEIREHRKVAEQNS